MDAKTQEARAECTALVNAFTYHLDFREYDKLAGLFAPDGVWERHGIRLNGREQILAAMSERPANQFTRHCTTSIHFKEIGDSVAKAHVYNLSYFSMEGPAKPGLYVYHPENMVFVDMHDTFRKTPEGWRFAERVTPHIMIPARMLDH